MNMYSGLIIDGPYMGRNVNARVPHIKLYVTPDAQMRLEAGQPTDPIKDIVSCNYVWSAGVWSCGEYLNAWADWEGDRWEGHLKPGARKS